MQYDYLVVGSGLFGAVFAQQAKTQGKKVLSYIPPARPRHRLP